MWAHGRREGDSVVPSGRGVSKGEWQIVQSKGRGVCGCGFDRVESRGSEGSVDDFREDEEESGSGVDAGS